MIEQHLQEIERRVSLIREELNPSATFRLEPNGLRVTATFSGGDDILYYNPSLHSHWRFRASDYIPIESGMTIKVGEPGEWKFRLVSEGQAITEKALTLKENTVTPKDILFGFWDSYHVPDDAPQNVKKLDWSRLENKGTIIPSIGGFEKDMPEADIRDRLKYRRKHMDAVDDIAFILLHDEPFYKGFTPEKQEQILKIAKEEIPGYKFAFSYARGALRDQPDQDRRVPEGLDVAMINNYTFHPQEYWPEMYITSQAEFDDDLEHTLGIVRSQGVQNIVLTGQAITQEGKYRQPPLESVRWNVEACYRHDLKGVIWFEYRNRSKWKGAESMPDFYNELKRVYETIRK